MLGEFSCIVEAAGRVTFTIVALASESRGLATFDVGGYGLSAGLPGPTEACLRAGVCGVIAVAVVAPDPARRPLLPAVYTAWMSQPCRSEEHTSELQSRRDLVCRLLLEK